MMLPFENQNIEFKREYVPDIRKEANTKDEQTPRLGNVCSSFLLGPDNDGPLLRCILTLLTDKELRKFKDSFVWSFSMEIDWKSIVVLCLNAGLTIYVASP